MIFKRKIYDEMLRWKMENSVKPAEKKKALLIEGARRVGKSTICEEFARREYTSYLLIDFSKAGGGVTKAFENKLNNLDDFFRSLSTAANNNRTVELVPFESVIIFDEVQDYPLARKCIDLLVKDGRYDYIETGSLISVRKTAADITLPVTEKAINMYPLGFEEFCWAVDEGDIIDDICRSFESRKKLDDGKHKAAMRLFREYMVVGGMPQSVEAFVDGGKNTNKLMGVDEEKRGILTMYRGDLEKLNSGDTSDLDETFDMIPGLLSRHEHSTEKYWDAFSRFADAMICNICYKCDNPGVNLNASRNDAYVKCYMGDTGLLISMIYNDMSVLNDEVYKRILNDKFHDNEGFVYENLIAQMLVGEGHNLFFFSNHRGNDKGLIDTNKSNIEIDFLILRSENHSVRVNPIEVKSGTSYTTTSLNLFKEKYHNQIGTGIVIHPGDLKYDSAAKILYIPSYMAFCL